MKKHIIHAAGCSHMGKIRANNEDNLYFNGVYIKEDEISQPFFADGEFNKANGFFDKFNNDIHIFSVCDGMGGEDFGEKASLLAVSELKQAHKSFKKGTSVWDKSMDTYVQKANNVICDLMKEKKCNAGTTFAAICTDGTKAKAYNLGDSRIYIQRDGVLQQVSEEHTLVHQLVSAGAITKEEAKTHPERNKITQHLGIFLRGMRMEAYKSDEIILQTGDKILLCSDGVTEMCEDITLSELLIQEKSASEICKDILDCSLNQGGKDNISCILLNIE